MVQAERPAGAGLSSYSESAASRGRQDCCAGGCDFHVACGAPKSGRSMPGPQSRSCAAEVGRAAGGGVAARRRARRGRRRRARSGRGGTGPRVGLDLGVVRRASRLGGAYRRQPATDRRRRSDPLTQSRRSAVPPRRRGPTRPARRPAWQGPAPLALSGYQRGIKSSAGRAQHELDPATLLHVDGGQQTLDSRAQRVVRSARHAPRTNR